MNSHHVLLGHIQCYGYDICSSL